MRITMIFSAGLLAFYSEIHLTIRNAVGSWLSLFILCSGDTGAVLGHFYGDILPQGVLESARVHGDW